MSYFDLELENEIMDNDDRELEDYYSDMAAEAHEADLEDEAEAMNAYDDEEYIGGDAMHEFYNDLDA